MKKVIIFGTFDTIHPGHLWLIDQAKKLGNVYVCLALDETIKKLKGMAPINSLNARKNNLQNFKLHVCPGSSQDRLSVLRKIRPDIVLLGYDQKVFVDQLESHISKEKNALKVVRLKEYKSGIFSSSKVRKVKEDSLAGFILIDKPSGEPSMRSISALRRITGIKKIGFAGTLDPLASGLLICGIASATSLIDWWHEFPKTYEVTAQLGCISDTYDGYGKIIKKSDKKPARDELAPVIRNFIGNIKQLPPMYSAKKIKGQKLYQLARKGEEIKRKEIDVTVVGIDMLSYEYPNLRLSIECSSGTYVRSIVNDLGEELGTGAIVSNLRRTTIGEYAVQDAKKTESLSINKIQASFIDLDSFRVKLNKYLFPSLF